MPTSTKPKTKNCTSGKLDSISTRSLERGKVSKTCNVSEDENIPDNKQEMSAIRTLEATIPIMSFDDGQKPSKKKRLNLRTRAAASKGTKAEAIEQKVQTALKDTDSSEDIEKPQSLSVKSNLEHNLDRINDVNNGGESDSTGTSKDMEAQNSSIKCCPVCKYDFTSLNSDFRDLDSDAEINEHINKCLDSGKSETKTNPSEHCQLCGKDISKYNSVQRQQHLNRCCDKLEKTQPKTRPEMSSILCPICGKPFKTTKTRQTHMKKCAKENNVSTHQLVELNRQENINNPTITAVTDSSTVVPQQNNIKSNQNTLGFVRNSKRKRRANLPVKNLDDDTQLALALSASMESDATDVREVGTKRRKKKKENSELPALLLRSDDEMKKVTEARAAAILCQWADDDDEIQCTPALAPSSLVKKYGKESSSDTEHLEILPQTAECDVVEDMIERCDSPIIEVRGGSHSKKNEKCGCANESESNGSVTTQGEDIKQYFTVDTQSRLWNLASLRADVVTHNDFFVPNLLPKSTPRKKKARNANLITNEEQLDHSSAIEKDNKDIPQDSPSKLSSQNDGLTESQQNDIEMLVELINDESDDTQSTGNEQEQNEEIDNTWFPSSGFCVRKDLHEIEDQNKEEVDTLLNDLSCMVGNPLLSDVEIVAKDNKKFCAHSFMLSARCATLAEILHTSETCIQDGDSNGLVRLELLDIDVRAVRAVLTYIYTAYFIPVVENAIEDVKNLVHRWNLNCNADKWEVIRDGTGRDHKDNVEHGNDDEGDLDVLLKSLWEGEEEIISGKNENENKFGDSILDDELGDMEIKIYTQATPQKSIRESIDKSAVVLDLDPEDKEVAIAERTMNDVVHSNDEQSNLESNVLEKEDEAILQTSDHIMCIPETPLKVSPCYSPEKNDAEESLREDDQTLVEQPAGDELETKTCQSSRSDDTNIGASSLRGHSSPVPKEFNGDELDHLNSSPISLPSPSSPVEMISSPERSPLPENLNDFYMEDECNELSKAQIFVMEDSSETSVSNSPNVCPNKCIAENMNVDGCLNTCISIVSPESRTTTSPIYSPATEDNVATADEDKVNEADVFSGFEGGNSMVVDQPAVKVPCRTRRKLCDENEDDSLLDIFATSSDSRNEQSPACNSKQDMNVDSCLDIDISIVSPKSTATSPPLYSPNSKDDYIGMEEAETELLKEDSDLRDRRPHGANSTHRAKQSLVFNSNDQGMSEDVDSNQENRDSYDENNTHKDVNQTTMRQSCNLTNQMDSWLDDSSLQSKDKIDFSQGNRRSHGTKTTTKDVDDTTKKETSSLQSRNTPSIEAQSDAHDDFYDDQSTTSRDVNDTPRRQSCTGTNKVDSWLDDSSIDTKNTSSTEGQRQGDCHDDKFMTPEHVDKTITKQSCTITNKTDSWLDDSSIKFNNTSHFEAQTNHEENVYDDDQFIDCYDDGGFNCDIDDYFNYDAHSTIEHDNVVRDDEKPGTSSATAQDTMESNVEEETTNNNQKVGENPKKKIGKAENNVQTRETKKENMSKDVKKGKNNKAEGKAKKSEKEATGKQTKAKNNPQHEFKLRDPRTPMLDYSNMATPELKGELKQYGVRPLAKRKMVIKLKEIYNYTHEETHSERESDEDDEKKSSKNKQESSEDEEVEPRSEDTNSQQGSTQDTQSCSDSEQNWYEEEQPSDDSEMLSQQSSSNLSKTLMSFLTQDHELYFKILKFMPISVSDVLETIKGNGIKCSAEQLKNFFDEQCITYSEPRPARVQRRGRRGKSKMKKV